MWGIFLKEISFREVEPSNGNSFVQLPHNGLSTCAPCAIVSKMDSHKNQSLYKMTSAKLCMTISSCDGYKSERNQSKINQDHLKLNDSRNDGHSPQRKNKLKEASPVSLGLLLLQSQHTCSSSSMFISNKI